MKENSEAGNKPFSISCLAYYKGSGGNTHDGDMTGSYGNLSAYRRNGLKARGWKAHLIDLPCLDLIEEPPSRSILHLPGYTAVVEIVGIGYHQLSVAGIQVVNDRFR